MVVGNVSHNTIAESKDAEGSQSFILHSRGRSERQVEKGSDGADERKESSQSEPREIHN